jgi:phage terminase Nu1 subunit (DNA packaging protein)
MHDLTHLLLKYEIADLFPERTQSPDYKRLIKRAVDFIDKEIAHLTK